MPSVVRVAVAKESLAFSAAHFLTLPGHICERLHGHNYRVAVEVEGAVDPATGFVVDFAVLKRILRDLVTPLDHRLLIPGENPSLTIHEEPDRVVLDYARPAWMVVPRQHTCILPVQHTTAELLAQHLAHETWTRLQAETANLQRLVLEVEESRGQTASAVRTA